MAEQSSFCVFREVTIPPRSLITKAHIYFYAFDTTFGVGIDANIYFTDEDNAQPPPNKTDLDGRSLTASIAWPSVEDWYDNKVYKTPDLKTILQEVIDRDGWTEGYNVMGVLKVTDGPDSGRFWSALEHLEEAERACLRVWWRPAEQIQTPYIQPVEEFQLRTFSCSMTTYPTDAAIYYTIDGSDPDETDTLYTTPFSVVFDTVVKARAYKEYWLDSEIATRNYTAYYPVSESYQYNNNQTFWRFGPNLPGGSQGSWQRYNGWCAFRSVTIPQGATITSAFLHVMAASNQADTKQPELYLRFNDVDDASPPTDADEFLAKLAVATAGTFWQPTIAWVINTWYDSSDFTSDLQTIVDRVGWSSGNTALLFVECEHYVFEDVPAGSNIRVGKGGAPGNMSNLPELHVTWSGGSGIYKPAAYDDDGETNYFSVQA